MIAGRRPPAASAPATIRVGTAGSGRPSCSSSTLRNSTPRPKGVATERSCSAAAAANKQTRSARVAAEDRSDRSVDALLRLRSAHAIEALIRRGVPQRLAAARIVEIHRDDAFPVDVRPGPAPAVGVAPAIGIAPAVAVIGPVYGDVGADAITHQAVRAAGRAGIDLQMRGDGAAQAALVDRIGDGTA